MSAPSHSPPRVLYREEQSFRQPWIWVLLVASLLLVVGLFGWGIYQQLVLGRPWGDRPMSDRALVFTGLGTLALMLAVIWLMYGLRLIVEVRDDVLIVRFRPLLRRVIPYADIIACEARRYRPILHYGGWGIRWGWKGRAYTVSGSEGVWLELRGSRPVMLGSRSAKRLARAIREAR